MTIKEKVYCNKPDCPLRKTFIGDTGEYSRNLCCNTACGLVTDDPPHPEATISGWVARDQPINYADKGNLTLFAEKPMRDYYDHNDLIYGFWSDNEKPTIPLSVDLFPSLTWQDEPIEVEITIKPKSK